MAYKCLECGNVFDEPNRWSESRGEYWGFSCSEEMDGCPHCRGDYEEMVECEICGEEHLADELNGGVCDECIDECRNDFDICYAVSIGQEQNIKINTLLASLFDPSDIEQILKEHIKERMTNVDCSGFIDADAFWFGERLAEEVKKNEQAKN